MLTETLRFSFGRQLLLSHTVQCRTHKLTEKWLQLGTDDLSETKVVFGILQA